MDPTESQIPQSRTRRQVQGYPPSTCDVCSEPISHQAGTRVYDAVVSTGRGRGWAWCCSECFRSGSGSLGTGRGQEYTLELSGKWFKTAG